jgi:hypothetical protein
MSGAVLTAGGEDVCPRIDELSRGGKDSGKNNHGPRLTGVHHVTVPTSDPLGTDWYVQVFGFTALLVNLGR